jgi:hypothetical protein
MANTALGIKVVESRGSSATRQNDWVVKFDCHYSRRESGSVGRGSRRLIRRPIWNRPEG